MLRGRRGNVLVICYWLLVIFYWLLFFPSSLQAATSSFSVTTTVTLSPVWQKAIEERSTVTLDTSSHQNIAMLTVKVQGIDDIIMPSENIQALFLKNDKLISRLLQITDKKGSTEFTFIYIKGETYRVILVDTAHEFPFVIKNISFGT